jgi:FtsH-binding integral membrane protein
LATAEQNNNDYPVPGYATGLPGLARRENRGRIVQWLVLVVLMLGGLAVALRYNPATHPLPLRIFLALSIFTALFSIRHTAAMPIAAMVYVAFLAGARRFLIPVFGIMHQDPLLLVIPAITGIFFFELAFGRKLRADTTMGKARIFLVLIMLLECVNPKQGGLKVGLTGLLFYLPPLFWSYIGRTLYSERLLRNMLRLLRCIAVVGSLYGLHQLVYGYAPWEKQWLSSQSDWAFMVHDRSHQFSFFSSATEYATVLVLAILSGWILFLTGDKWALLPLPLFGIALFYISGRGPVVQALLGTIVVWAIQGKTYRSWAPRLALAGLVFVGGLVYGLNHAESLAGNKTEQGIVSHQVGGLLNPTDSKKSTAKLHTDAMIGGLEAAFSDPLGDGTGSTTLGVGQFKGTGGNSEVDISNMGFSLGFLGLLAFVTLIGSTVYMAFRTWHNTRSVAALAASVFGPALFLGWLNSDNYTTMLVLWFTFGAMEASYLLSKRSQLNSMRGRADVGEPRRIDFEDRTRATSPTP